MGVLCTASPYRDICVNVDEHFRRVFQFPAHVAADVPNVALAGAFVAEEAGRVVAYVTTTVDRAAGNGRIANLAVVAELRGRGLGRQLVEHALQWFRAEGLSYALIESMAHNEAGRGLYTSVGFQEIGQLVHYAMKL